MKLLLGVSPSEYRKIWMLIVCTGLRSGELAALTGDDVDLDREELMVRAEVAKNHRARTIPLAPSLVAMLKSHRKQADREVRSARG